MTSSDGPWAKQWRTIGTNVRIEMENAVKLAAAATGLTVGAWMRQAAEEKLARDTAPSIVPQTEEVA